MYVDLILLRPSLPTYAKSIEVIPAYIQRESPNIGHELMKFIMVGHLFILLIFSNPSKGKKIYNIL